MLNRCLACSDEEISFVLPTKCESFYQNVLFCNSNQEIQKEPVTLENYVWELTTKEKGNNTVIIE